jgi:hypothetical protein
MIVYERTAAGQACNLRFVPDSYAAQPGETVVPGDVLPPLESLHDPAFALADAKRKASAAIDQAAEAARLRYLTAGAGQALTYLEKERDARAYAAAGYPSTQLASYLFVDAERRATGQTGRQAADAIIATADAWRAKAAAIDHERRKGKLAVEAAADAAAVEAARAAALAALAGL